MQRREQGRRLTQKTELDVLRKQVSNAGFIYEDGKRQSTDREVVRQWREEKAKTNRRRSGENFMQVARDIANYKKQIPTSFKLSDGSTPHDREHWLQ